MSNTRATSWWPWLVLLGCIGCYSIPVGVIGNTAGLFVAPVMKQYGWDQTSTTMYRTIQPLVALACTPFAGKLFARYSPRWILTATSLIFGAASIATAYATELWQWNLYGVVYGITCSFFMYLAAPVLVNRWFHKGNGLALGIVAAVLSVLAAIVSPIVQSLITAHSWQYARVEIFAIGTVASVLFSVVFIRDSPLKMGVLAHGELASPEAVEGEPEAILAVAGATRPQALRTPGLYLVILIAMIIVMTAAFFQQVPAYTAKSPLGAAAGALAVSIVMIGGTCGKLILGWLSDRFGVKPTAIGAMLCGALGMFLAFIATSVVPFYIGMAIFGVGYAGLTVIVPLLVRSSFGSLNYAEIYSWISMGIFLATSVSFLVYGRIVDLTGSFTGCFILVIALYIVAAILIVPAVNLSRGAWVKVEEKPTVGVGV